MRWWFARDVEPVADTDFTEQRLVERVDHDLANGIGNVAKRIATLAERAGVEIDGQATPIDGVAGLDEDVLGALAEFDLRGATEAICAAVDALNRDLETTRPWELIRLATPANRRLEELLARYLASVWVIAAADPSDRSGPRRPPGVVASSRDRKSCRPASPGHAAPRS